MKPLAEIDATHCSGDVSKEWYWNSEVAFVPQQFCSYYIRLFREPEILFERFSKTQLEEGFWGRISGTDWSLRQLVWETALLG